MPHPATSTTRQDEMVFPQQAYPSLIATPPATAYGSIITTPSHRRAEDSITRTRRLIQLLVWVALVGGTLLGYYKGLQQHDARSGGGGVDSRSRGGVVGGEALVSRQPPQRPGCCTVPEVANTTTTTSLARHTTTMSALNKAAIAAVRRQLARGSPSGKADGVIYLVWRGGTQVDADRVVEALSRLDLHFNKAFHYPVIIFHEGEVEPADRRKLEAACSTVPLTWLPLPWLPSLPPHDALEFMAVGLPQLLAQAYQWQMRLDDGLLLASPVGLDPFLFLDQLQARMGHVGEVAVQGERDGRKGEGRREEEEEDEVQRRDHDRLWLLAHVFALETGHHQSALVQEYGQRNLRPRVVVSHREIWATDLIDDFLAFLHQHEWPESGDASLVEPLHSVLSLLAVEEPRHHALRFLRVEEEGRPPPLRSSNGPSFLAAEADDLQPLFTARHRGWTGGDVATSFRFPPRGEGPIPSSDYYMWLFGDTFVGKIDRSGTRVPGSFFIHNSIAFVPGWEKASVEAKPSVIDFVWNTSEAGGCPTTVLIDHQVNDECLSVGSTYFWPISGIGAHYYDEGSGKPLSKVVMLAVVWSWDPFEEGPMSFYVEGSALVVVDNPHDPPKEWEYRSKRIPGTDWDHGWYASLVLADEASYSGGRGGVATSLDDMLYILGNNGSNPLGTPEQISKAILGRVSLRSLVDLSFEDMEVWSYVPEEVMPSWVPLDLYLAKEFEAVPLFSPSYSETSLMYSPFLKSWYMVVVDLFAATILLYTAPHVTGPWVATEVYRIPEPFNNTTKYLCYAGKSHPELAEENEIIMTYMSNTWNVEDLFEVAGSKVYVPNFVRLTFK